jgi:branched-chain amino acid transport system ATP-binding protein
LTRSPGNPAESNATMERGPSRELLLQIDHVGKDFGNFTAVREVSLDVHEGDLKAIIGPNGAGKTTLFNMLSGQLRPSRGRVLYRGLDIGKLPTHRLSHLGIGRSFQLTNVFRGLTVLENVRIATQRRLHRDYDFVRRAVSLTATRELAEQILETIGLAPYRRTLASTLSHGDQRRLEVGIVLAGDPRLVLLDEPTSGMSREEARATMTLLRDIARERTVLFVEHNMEFVMAISQSIVVMQSGAVIAQGPPSNIRVDPAVRRAYLGNLYE